LKKMCMIGRTLKPIQRLHWNLQLQLLSVSRMKNHNIDFLKLPKNWKMKKNGDTTDPSDSWGRFGQEKLINCRSSQQA
jgi:hypothetical protein